MPVDFEGFDEIMDTLKRTVESAPNLQHDVLTRLANRLIELIHERWDMVKTPKSTGQYINAWYISSEGDGSITISNPYSDLFIILEFTGAIPHDIYPHGPYPLHWTDELGDHFAMHVYNKGMEPKPHVRPAEEQLWTNEFMQILVDELKKYLPLT